MKIKNLLFATLLLAIASCSNNSDTPATPNPTVIDPTGNSIVTTFLPISANTNKWTYGTETSIVLPAPAAGTLPTTGTDVLGIDSDVVLNTYTYKLMKTVPTTPTGFYSTSLNNNKLRVDGSSIKLTGNISVNVSTNVLNFAVNDFVMFKENAIAGTTVGTTSGPFNTTIVTPTLSVPVSGTYTLTSVADGTVASMVVSGITYTDVKKTILTLNANATASLANVTAPALDMQPLVISTQYYAKNVGLIKADTTVKYEFAAAVISLLPSTIPAKGERLIKENLTSKNF